MSKAKPTKVPVMRPNQPYEAWKKELRIWEATNIELCVEPKIQAGSLFQSLEGSQRETVLSELAVEEISSVDGVKNIIQTLDYFYLGNEGQNAFNVIDEFLSFKRAPDSTIEQLIIDFQLKMNKVKNSGTVLSERILGYALLKAANLTTDKQDMVKATCQQLTYKTVKIQLEKVGLSSKSSNIKTHISNVKVEQCFCGNLPTNVVQPESTDSSSDDDLQKESTFYSFQKRRFEPSTSGGKFKVNPADRYGHIRACAYCKCHYHWILDCPYAPASVKNEVANKTKRRNNQKPL